MSIRGSAPFRAAGWILAGAFAFHASVPAFADGSHPDSGPAASSSPAPGSGSPPAGPSESDLRRALPARSFQRVDPAAFAALVQAHPAAGRLLTGPGLAAAVYGAGAPPAASRRPGPCDTLAPPARAACADSLARIAAPLAPADSSARPAGPVRPDSALGNRGVTQRDSAPYVAGRGPGDRDDGEEGAALYGRDGEERARGWFAGFIADLRDGDSKGGGGGCGGDELAAVIYVAVGVVVVGAFLIYGIQTLVELAMNPQDNPVFHEGGLRLSYSGHAWRDGAGTDLYRDAYLAGLRYGIGIARPGMDLGLAVEGGYLDIHLRPAEGAGRAFDFKGGYLVAGPLLRFGAFDPFCFSLEFLNGTSTHASIGWISKARMALQARMGGRLVAGAHLGAVFYDLEFLDGLAWRRGNFNRDLSLVGGLDFGWATDP